eukprot:NODE_10445_length_1351_cov_6.040033.p1 GENE.NODE_10445_length_1351_cov_6.040033~~NODE_10445_length_1351_cov_6.040033.p1  ORF type:complete len:308 (+),score=77.17 NODE_10445_length_1351_cov_6.040033:82-1005(+)
MGFKYVLVPASPNDAMQELSFDSDITDLQKDNFRDTLERYYCGQGQSIDRDVLLAQLKERTGVDLAAKEAAGEMSGVHLDHLLHSVSVEIFPVQMPTKASGFHAVSVYCDDKGVAKELEENRRVSGLVQACGYVGQTFRGDCFIGRVFDDTEDEWRRIDFTFADCNSDAPWVLETKRGRENRNVGDMSSFASKLGAKNPAKITPDMLEDSKAKGETKDYTWRQGDDDVEITFKTEGLQKGDKKLVKVVSTRQRLKVEVRGEVLIDAALAGTTDPDLNTWTLSDGILQVTLSKSGEEASWPELLQAVP